MKKSNHSEMPQEFRKRLNGKAQIKMQSLEEAKETLQPFLCCPLQSDVLCQNLLAKKAIYGLE